MNTKNNTGPKIDPYGEIQLVSIEFGFCDSRFLSFQEIRLHTNVTSFGSCIAFRCVQGHSVIHLFEKFD